MKQEELAESLIRMIETGEYGELYSCLLDKAIFIRFMARELLLKVRIRQHLFILLPTAMNLLWKKG